MMLVVRTKASTAVVAGVSVVARALLARPVIAARQSVQVVSLSGSRIYLTRTAQRVDQLTGTDVCRRSHTIHSESRFL